MFSFEILTSTLMKHLGGNGIAWFMLSASWGHMPGGFN
jgi:hypothetical protein